VGRNTSLTLNPSSLGQTKNNYIGKSQYPDPYLNGLVDDFRIYSRALSAAEVLNLANTTAQNLLPAGDITALKEVSVTTPAGTEPELPSVVEATYGEGSVKWVDVKWENIEPALYVVPGSFEVRGMVSGTVLKAIAKVTVIEAGAAGQSENPVSPQDSAVPAFPAIPDMPAAPNSLGKLAGNT
jgi:hypothetical protein